MALVLIGVVCVVVALPGLRLLRLSRRTGERSEALLAAFFLCGAGALGCRLLAIRLAAGSGEVALEPGAIVAINAAGHALGSAAVIAMTVFVRAVFHPEARWAARLATALIAALIASCGLLFLTDGLVSEQDPVAWAANALRAAPILWAFVACFDHASKLERRLALGLADPVVTNRFWLWTLWTGCLCLVPLLALVIRAIGLALGSEEDPALRGLLVGTMRIVLLPTALVVALAIGLSFHPPARYLAWLRRRSEAAAA